MSEVVQAMKASFYAFSILDGLEYEALSKQLEEFVKENAPTNEEETEGFINFEKLDKDGEYTYFEYYFSFVTEKPDPRGIGTYKVPIRDVRQIVLTKDPFMLIVFTPRSKQRDRILSFLPIDPEHREGFGISSDFIEFINVPKPEDWADEVFEDVIEPRGRKGHGEKGHTIIERYPDPDDREKDLEKSGKKYVFRDFAEVVVSLEEVSLKLALYPNGKVTTYTLGHDRKLLAPYLAEALKILKEAERRYNNLKSSAQGGGNG